MPQKLCYEGRPYENIDLSCSKIESESDTQNSSSKYLQSELSKQSCDNCCIEPNSTNLTSNCCSKIDAILNESYCIGENLPENVNDVPVDLSKPTKFMYRLIGTALNANGFDSKMDIGIIDDYLARFAISSVVETNTDDPIINKSALSEFNKLSKDPPDYRVNYSHGGFHGISVFTNPLYITKAEVITDLTSECVLWVKMQFLNFFDFIYGAVYIPCTTSKFFRHDLIVDINNDIQELNVRFNFLPTMMAGDWNGHTGVIADYLEGDNVVANYTGCELLAESPVSGGDINTNFSDIRYNSDTREVDENGDGVISVCINHNFKIVNGRIGDDKFLGKSTCHKSDKPSVIDYLLVSENMLPYLSNFNVEMFDSNLSDVHCPIEFEFIFDETNFSMPNCAPNEKSAQNECQDENLESSELPNLKFKWSQDISKSFKASFSESILRELINDLEILTKDVSQMGIDNLCLKLNDFMIDTAKASGAYAEIHKRKGNTRSPNPKGDHKPWKDSEFFTKRKEYYRVKNKLRRLGKKSMCNQKAREFKKFVQSKKKNFQCQMNKKLRLLKSNNSKEYWDLLKKSVEGVKARNKLNFGLFLEHFKKLSQAENQPDSALDLDDPLNECESLNIAFEISEIYKVIKGLKNNKAAGIDFLRNEFLKNAPYDLVKFISHFFNLILDTGLVPDVWCKGLIMPLYKNKGSHKDPDNYRGITLLSCLGKLFTACLSDRFANFMYNDNKMGVEQAGFRPGFSTMDHIFALHSIIEYYKSKKSRVYVAFIDYTKAFDLIDRSSLWLKLIQTGIKGKIINVIKNMYENAKSCVKQDGKISEFFSCNVGVRQGENLSPVLFAIYLNDFNESIGSSFNGLDSLSSDLLDKLDVFLKLYVLLYADDTIIMAETPEELQKALDKLTSYCEKWSLKINISKSNIIIFSAGKVKKYPKFYVDQKEIKVVEDYVYLGVNFHYNGSFKNAIKKQIKQARKAMYALLSKTRILGLPLDIVLELFNVCVVPILLYGAEIWAYENVEDIEIFHRQFLRIILKAHKFTPNPMLYGETGSYDLNTLIDSRIVNFWAKLRNSGGNKISSILCNFISKFSNENVLNTGQNEIEPSSDTQLNSSTLGEKEPEFRWCQKVRAVLKSTGFSNVYLNPSLFGDDTKKSITKKLKDNFVEKWKESVASNSQCSSYRLFKTDHCIEKYLLILDHSSRISLANFRMRVHNLPITKNRFACDKETRSSTIGTECHLCNSALSGDEDHYLFLCTYFKREREKVFPTDLVQNCNLFKFKKWEFVFKEEKGHLTLLAQFAKSVMSNFTIKKTVKACPKPEYQLKERITRSGRTSKPPKWKLIDLEKNPGPE